jgi:hypothetical protein
MIVRGRDVRSSSQPIREEEVPAMRSSAAFCVTVLLTLGLVTIPAWGNDADEAATSVPAYGEPVAELASGPYDSDRAVLLRAEPPVEADSDCLRVIRNTTLSDAEQQIDEKANVTWVATDAERETSEKCRAIGAR